METQDISTALSKVDRELFHFTSDLVTVCARKEDGKRVVQTISHLLNMLLVRGVRALQRRIWRKHRKGCLRRDQTANSRRRTRMRLRIKSVSRNQYSAKWRSIRRPRRAVAWKTEQNDSPRS